MRSVSLLALSISLGVLAGCSGAGGPTLPGTVPVKGVVIVDGKPLANATVSLIPVGGTQGIGSAAYTDKDGKFEMKTSSGSTQGVGAPPGKYKVMLSKMLNKDGTDFPPDSKEGPANVGATESLPMNLSDPVRTTLMVEIPETGNENLKIEASSKGGPPGGGPPGMPGMPGGMMPM